MPVIIKRQFGMTIIEVMAALTILSFAAYVLLLQAEVRSGDRIIDNAARKATMVASASKRYRMDTGAWPTSPSQLVSNNYLTSEQVKSGFGTNFNFSTVGQSLRLRHGTPEGRLARRLAGVLPEGTASGSTVTFLVPPAGAEASLAGLYARDGSRELTGDMDGGGNNAANFNNISAGNDLSAGRDVRASQDLRASRDVRAGRNVRASNNVVALNQSMAKRFGDRDNTSYYVDPASRSNVNKLNAKEVKSSGRVYGSAFYDSNNNSYYFNPSSHSKVAGNIETDGEFRGDMLRSQTNGSYYVRPNSSTKVRGNITTEGDMIANGMTAKSFVDSDNTGYYVNPSSDTRIRTLYATQLIDTNDGDYFVNPSVGSTSINVKGRVEAGGFSFSGSNSVGGSCQYYGTGGASVTSSGELLYCDTSNTWRKVAKEASPEYVQKTRTLVNESAGHWGSTWYFTTSSLSLPDKAYAIQLQARCGTRTSVGLAIRIKRDNSTTQTLLTTQAAGSGDNIISTNSLIMSIEDTSQFKVSMQNGPCDSTGGFLLQLMGYFTA